MAGRKYSCARAIAGRRFQLNIHQFIHVFQHQHVTVQLYHPVIFDKRERSEFAPAVVEPCIINIVLVYRRKKIFHALLRDIANVERFVAIFGKRIGIKGNQRILGPVFFERIVKGKEAGEVLGIGDKGGPYLVV